MEWTQLDKRILNTYNIIRQIDEDKGIFIVEDSEGQWWFLKVVPEDSIQLSLVEKLLSTEVEGVNRIVECFTSEGYCYLIKEYIHGSNLFDVILSEGTFSEVEALDMLIDLSQSLNELYQKCGLIFKDLHPKNIMLHHDKYVLVDTETVRVVKEDQSSDTQVIGVAGFMAPEQYGFAQSTIQSDMYSLGMVARFALTGEMPSLLKNRIELNKSICTSATMYVLDKMTEFAPENRYEDYSACMKALVLAKRGKQPIIWKQAVLVLFVFGSLILTVSWVATSFLTKESVDEAAYIAPVFEEIREEVSEAEDPIQPMEKIGGEVNESEIAAVPDEEVVEPEAVVEEMQVEQEEDDWWKVGKPVVNREFWDAEVGLPFEAEWLTATYSADEGMEQYLKELSVLYFLDDKYIYYRFQYQTEYPSRVAMFSASNQKDNLFSFVNSGSIRGSNDWVVRLKRADISVVEPGNNTGFLIDFFDTQPFDRMFLRIPFIDELIKISKPMKSVKPAAITNFQKVSPGLVEWFEGDWESLAIEYLDGSEKRIEEVAVSVLKTDADIYLTLKYPSEYPADVVLFLPNNRDGLQSRIDKGTVIGDNQWTIRIPKNEWKECVAKNGSAELVINLMLGSLDNPGTIKFEIP